MNGRAVDAGFDTILGHRIPGGGNPPHGPAVAVNCTAFHQRIDLGHGRPLNCRTQSLEKGRIDRRNAQVQTGQVGFVDGLAFAEKQVERAVIMVASYEFDVLLACNLLRIVDPAVFTQFGKCFFLKPQNGCFWNKVAKERLGTAGDVIGPLRHTLDHLKRAADGGCATQKVDLNNPFSLFIDLRHQLFEGHAGRCADWKAAHAAQSHLFGGQRRGKECARRNDRGKPFQKHCFGLHHYFSLWVKVLKRRLCCHCCPPHEIMLTGRGIFAFSGRILLLR